MVNFSKMNFQFRCLDASFFSSPFFKKGSFSKSHDHPGYYYSVITPFSGYKENFIQANQKKKKTNTKTPHRLGHGNPPLTKSSQFLSAFEIKWELVHAKQERQSMGGAD